MIIWGQRIMPTPSKWTPVKDYFKSPYSLTFGSDLFVPKQDFLLFFSPECCFVLGADQFPLTAVLTSWELPAMMCPGSTSSYVPHRQKMLQHYDPVLQGLVTTDHATMVEWTRERKGWNNVQEDKDTEQNTSILVLSSIFFKTFSHYIISSLQENWNQSIYPVLIHTAGLQPILPPLSLPLQENCSPWGNPAELYLVWIIPALLLSLFWWTNKFCLIKQK